MSQTIYAKVRELPDALQRALAAVGYGRPDVGLVTREKVSIAQGGGAGYRCFAIVVDLAANTYAITWGSWGGANMFNPRNAVDLDTTEHEIRPGLAVILGSVGGDRPVYASITLHPENLRPLLPAAAELSPAELGALGAYRYKSGPYRAEALARSGATPAELDGLVTRGLLKRAKNGATQLTTEGRNALAAAGR